MTTNNTLMSNPTNQPATVTFIDNHLAEHHPAFAGSMVMFDPMAGQYVPNNQDVISTAPDGDPVASSNSAAGQFTANSFPPRPTWTDTAAMKFWESIFPEAMVKLAEETEPNSKLDPTFNIRKKTDWDSVYDTLQAARVRYQEQGGKVGWLRKVRRRIADNITPGAEVARIASTVTPNDPYSTPVLGTVQVLLDVSPTQTMFEECVDVDIVKSKAVQTASRAREKILGGFDGLIPIFSDVELFLGTFPKDTGIRNASVDLTVTTLHAVEGAIGFFLSNELMRGGKALLSGADYEKKLLDSLGEINTKSKNLMEEATKSHIYEFHMYSQETQRLYKELLPIVVRGYNSIHDLLSEHLEKKDRELERARQENLYLRVENGILRATSPLPQIQSTPAPPQPVMGWYISQDTLKQLLGHDNIDLTDMEFVVSKKGQFPEKQRVRTEQIINTQLFQSWMVSPHSAKLLIHWDTHPPKTIAGISPLSVFAMTITHVLRSKDRFISALWICGCHADITQPGAGIGGGAMVTSFINQLLRQHIFDTRLLHEDVDVASLQEGDIDEFIKLLEWLVHRLPPEITVIFIADGVVLYERPEFEADALRVFSRLLMLSGDTSVSATVKVLFVSTPATDFIRGAFEKEDLIITVDGLPQLAWAASEERVTRELGLD
ncbi:hypothetical protein NM208_g781 [Fusarium decemcellulare]|uniref:Uncharacterized protein n=1 Tax=Fusarium decemcellulare TaxID=57161 RepID=A0ACC1SYE5_9HYPO|nr:hypothetical protein NM208_g781 [Fusarium decemcellulare]